MQTLTIGGVTFVNLTPHTIKIVTPGFMEGEPLSLEVPPSGEVARVETEDGAAMPFHDSGPFAWIKRLGPPRYGTVIGLPEWKAPMGGNTVYLVSILVLQALAGKGRTDVYAPDTGPLGVVRDSQGRITATTRLICAA